MRTIYQSTDDNGHTIRALKLSTEGNTSPVYPGHVSYTHLKLPTTRDV